MDLACYTIYQYVPNNPVRLELSDCTEKGIIFIHEEY